MSPIYDRAMAAYGRALDAYQEYNTKRFQAACDSAWFELQKPSWANAIKRFNIKNPGELGRMVAENNRILASFKNRARSGN